MSESPAPRRPEPRRPNVVRTKRAASDPLRGALPGALHALASVLSDRLGLSGPPWAVVSALDLNLVGYVMAGMFALTWAVGLAAWRLLHVEERLSGRLRPSRTGS